MHQIQRDIRKKANKNKAKILGGFFKTGKGEYGEGDVFIGGNTSADLRKVAKENVDVPLTELLEVIASKYHDF